MSEFLFTAMIAGIANGCLMAFFCLYTILIAKYFNIGIIKVSIFNGITIFRKKVQNTEFVCGVFPGNSYVKLAGLNPEGEEPEDLTFPSEMRIRNKSRGIRIFFRYYGSLIFNILILIFCIRFSFTFDFSQNVEAVTGVLNLNYQYLTGIIPSAEYKNGWQNIEPAARIFFLTILLNIVLTLPWQILVSMCFLFKELKSILTMLIIGLVIALMACLLILVFRYNNLQHGIFSLLVFWAGTLSAGVTLSAVIYITFAPLVTKN